MLDQKIHRQILFGLLRDIFGSHIGKYLAFKGGTATYFFYGLTRFSTDLDFDLIDSSGSNIDAQMIQLLNKYGSVKSGSKLILSYGPTSVNIKVDINRKVRQHNEYEIKNFYGTDMRTQTQSTIVANKLVALYERFAQRDLFDVWFFLSNHFPIHEAIIIERLGFGLQPLYQRLIEKLTHLPLGYKMLDGLGELLMDEKQKHFVKTKLLDEVMSYMKFLAE